MQIPDIKRNLPITKVLAHYSIKIDKNNHIRCPFHPDDKPSCKIYPETNTFHCFGCGATGDQENQQTDIGLETLSNTTITRISLN